MADRRMFTKKITDADAFTALPPTTQALYFHLCMNADDDGFNNKIRQAMFNAHADQNDYNLLVQQRFIIPFESGIIVIKHWKLHNIIRNDRYHETEYVEEKARLILKENGVYTENDNQLTTNGIPDDNQMETEVRLGKVSIGKDREGNICYQKITDMYNEICVSYPRLTKLSDARKKAIRARLNTYTVDDFKKLFEMAESSNFLKGNNNNNWSATFDWLIKDANMAKVLDGNYVNKEKETISSGGADKLKELERRYINGDY